MKIKYDIEWNKFKRFEDADRYSHGYSRCVVRSRICKYGRMFGIGVMEEDSFIEKLPHLNQFKSNLWQNSNWKAADLRWRAGQGPHQGRQCLPHHQQSSHKHCWRDKFRNDNFICNRSKSGMLRSKKNLIFSNYWIIELLISLVCTRDS